jgi:hypothetical protein
MVSAATEQLNLGEALMPWQGHRDNLIDRFDVRAVMDIIQPYTGPKKYVRRQSCMIRCITFECACDHGIGTQHALDRGSGDSAPLHPHEPRGAISDHESCCALPRYQEKKQVECLLNYERYRGIVESKRLKVASGTLLER